MKRLPKFPVGHENCSVYQCPVCTDFLVKMSEYLSDRLGFHEKETMRLYEVYLQELDVSALNEETNNPNPDAFTKDIVENFFKWFNGDLDEPVKSEPIKWGERIPMELACKILSDNGISYDAKDRNHIKVGSVNFYPSSGSINYDNSPKEEEKGIEAFLNILFKLGYGKKKKK